MTKGEPGESYEAEDTDKERRPAESLETENLDKKEKQKSLWLTKPI
jgi:hypothetical protein